MGKNGFLRATLFYLATATIPTEAIVVNGKLSGVMHTGTSIARLVKAARRSICIGTGDN
jgi:hypothetical protein